MSEWVDNNVITTDAAATTTTAAAAAAATSVTTNSNNENNISYANREWVYEPDWTGLRYGSLVDYVNLVFIATRNFGSVQITYQLPRNLLWDWFYGQVKFVVIERIKAHLRMML